MPSTRITRSSRTASVAAAVAVALAALVALADPAAAQTLPETPRRPVFGPLVSFAAGLVVNLVLGVIVVGVAPDYSRALVDRIRSEPFESFVFGLVTYVAVIVASILLAITIIGIVVLIPGLIVLAVVGVAANVLAVVTVGAVLTGRTRDASLWTALVAGAVVVSLLTAIPVVGDLTNFVLGTLGMGAIASQYWERR